MQTVSTLPGTVATGVPTRIATGKPLTVTIPAGSAAPRAGVMVRPTAAPAAATVLE